MQFVSSGVFPIFPHFSEEIRIRVERAGKLVSVALVEKFLIVFIPSERLVVVESVAAADPDVGEAGIRLMIFEGFRYFIEKLDRCAVEFEVGSLSGEAVITL